MSRAALLPVSVLTGFLGSGKTTLLGRLIRHPEMDRTACVINEFGAVGLDDVLVRLSRDDIVLLDSGCLCCTIRGDLIRTLRDLFRQRVTGTVPEFDRVVIETTGLSDPAPILHTLMTDPLIAARYRLDGVITTVDAVLGDGQLDRHPESVKQAALADRLVLTKTDLAPGPAVARLKDRLRRLNPAAPLLEAVRGDLAPDRLFGAGLYNPAIKGPDVARWLHAEAYRPAEGHAHVDGHEHEPGHEQDPDGGRGRDVKRHDDHIRAFCLERDRPVRWEDFTGWIEALIAARGPDLLRVKGMVWVEGTDRPVVIHGVQHLFHPPAELDAWPGGVPCTRIVFITRDVGQRMVEQMFDGFLVPAGA